MLGFIENYTKCCATNSATNMLKSKRIVKGTNFSEMRVANAASLALMLQERAEPSLLFLKARIAMILQILRTLRRQEITGLNLCCIGKAHNYIDVFVLLDRWMWKNKTKSVTLLWHLPLLTDPEHFERFALRV